MRFFFLLLFLSVSAFSASHETHLRRYYEALEKHTEVLLLTNTSIKNVCIPFSFADTSIKKLVKKITKTGEISLLRNVLLEERFQDRAGIDTLFLQEFGVLLLSLYQHVIWTKTRKPEVRFSFLNLISLYIKLKAIPLQELFALLDKCLALYRKILEEQKFPFDDVSLLGDWFLEHWPILIIFSINGFFAWQKWKAEANKKKESISSSFWMKIVLDIVQQQR